MILNVVATVLLLLLAFPIAAEMATESDRQRLWLSLAGFVVTILWAIWR